jgi:hypothetical protein
MIRAVLPAKYDAAPKRFLRLRQCCFAAAQIVLSGALFLLALIGVCRLLSSCLPPLAVPLVDEKLKFFSEHRDEFDTLFFGSSRTYHQLLPEAFDEVTAAHGTPTKSFNFGIDGLFPPEDGYVAEKLFASRPAKLRRVFIEISYFRHFWVGMDPDSIRALYWHDGRSLLLIGQDVFTPYDPARLLNQGADEKKKAKPFRWKNWRKEWSKTSAAWGRKWEQFFGKWHLGGEHSQPDDVMTHVRIFLRRMINAGRGAELISRLGQGTTRKFDWSVLGTDFRGAKPMAHPKQVASVNLEKFDALLEKVRAEPIPLLPQSLAQAANTRRIVALVRSVGAEPILFVAPDVQPCRRFLPDEPKLPMFDFTEVAKWPQLYRREQRIDSSHLDREGSLEFTRAFALMFLEHEQQKSYP